METNVKSGFLVGGVEYQLAFTFTRLLPSTTNGYRISWSGNPSLTGGGKDARPYWLAWPTVIGLPLMVRSVLRTAQAAATQLASSEPVGLHGLFPHPCVALAGDHPAAVRDSPFQTRGEAPGRALSPAPGLALNFRWSTNPLKQRSVLRIFRHQQITLFAHRHGPPKIVEEVFEKHHLVLLLGRFRGLDRRQHRHPLAVRSQIPRPLEALVQGARPL